jgi:hypothetical protein
MPISTIGSNSLNQTSDLTINGQTVGKGGGNVATNTAHGYQALNSNTTGATGVAIGYQAGYTNSTGPHNTFVGTQAGYSSTGGENTCIGRTAGYSISTGTGNTFIGPGNGATSNGAGYYVTTGSKNSILGGYSGNQGGLDIRTASNNIVLSDGDGNPRVNGDSNGRFTFGTPTTNGNSAAVVISTTTGQDPQLCIGGTALANDPFLYLQKTGTNFVFRVYSTYLAIYENGSSGGVTLTKGATSWGAFSDSRLKNITGTYTSALSDILQIKPVKFTWKSDTENKPQVGVLAQSVQSVVPEAVEFSEIRDGDGTEYLTVRYNELIPLMIASIQELKTIVDAQAAEIAELKAKVA